MKTNPKTGRIEPTHGMRYTTLYRVFNGMVDRCCNPRCRQWPDYGGRGITICDEWLNDRTLFFAWAKENGYRSDLVIDRVDNNSGYRPNNCRWADKLTSSRNRRSTKLSRESAAVVKSLALIGVPQKTVGALYGIKFQTVSEIKLGTNWPGLDDLFIPHPEVINCRRLNNRRSPHWRPSV